MSLLTLCNDVIDIKRKSTALPSAANLGGQTISFATVYTAAPCTIQPATGRTINEFAKRNMQVSHTCYLAPNGTYASYSISTGDIAVHATQGTFLCVWSEDQAGRGQVFALHLLKK